MDIMELASMCMLHSINGIGTRTLWKIKEEYGSFNYFINLDSGNLYKTFLTPALAEQVISVRSNLSPAKYLDEIYRRGINIVTIEDLRYPVLLTTISDPPYLLYYRGNIEIASDICFAVVGARAATVYGKNAARKIGSELAANSLTVVSGMARGVDTEAHRGALDVQGKTIAVLGNGLNMVYPAENARLCEDISQYGLVVSEYPPSATPEPGHFPLRNRIISGLSRGVIVVEARKKSGALITADFALEQGRDVFAVPGPITSKNSEGTNNLIKQGAKLVSCIDDVLEDYYDVSKAATVIQPEILPPLEEDEAKVLACMEFEAVHFDRLLQLTKFDIGLLSTVMLALELKSMVKSMPGNFYIKIG